jgi:hypothetical protein
MTGLGPAVDGSGCSAVEHSGRSSMGVMAEGTPCTAVGRATAVIPSPTARRKAHGAVSGDHCPWPGSHDHAGGRLDGPSLRAASRRCGADELVDRPAPVARASLVWRIGEKAWVATVLQQDHRPQTARLSAT